MNSNKMLERFLSYVKIDTRSNAKSRTIPTTLNQVKFAQDLAQEMKEIGLTDIHYIIENGYVVGTIPATTDRKVKRIGFISHLDTADFNSEGIKPQVQKNYDGESSLALGDSGYFLSPREFPNLKNYKGDTLIHTDGTTLLGADDKAGIAEILTMADILINEKPEIEHGEIRIGFGPDEEIGRGADLFDILDFDVDFAFTADNGLLGEIEYETFSAAQAVINFQGKNVHPGTAKNLMVNALQLAIDFHAQLPKEERPELTEGYEGFNHLLELHGTPEFAHARYIIRDFDNDSFENRKQYLLNIAKKINKKLGENRISVQLEDQYYNMAKIVEKNFYIIELAQKAMKNLGIKSSIVPFRGGTDGSKISMKGLPTPNLFAGGENCHGRFEFVSLQTMEKAVDTFIEIVRLNALV